MWGAGPITTPGPDGDAYARWIIEHDALSDDDRRKIRAHVSLLPRRPIISLIMPLDDTPGPLLVRAVASIRAQLYPFWEIWISGRAPSPEAERVIREAAEADPRVRRLVPGAEGRMTAVNAAIVRAEGEAIALLSPCDLLAEGALYEVALAMLACPEADILFSDEDRVDEAGRRHHPLFKPMWSPELLVAYDALGRLTVYRSTFLEHLGGLRGGYEGCEDWDLALRATAATTSDRMCHIPVVLYHRGTSMPDPRRAGSARRAVEDWLRSEGMADARVEPSRMLPGALRVSYPLPDPLPFVSVIIPTRDQAALLARTCEGLLHRTDWPADRLEILLVDNGSTEADALELLRRTAKDPRVRVLHDPASFNYPRLNNKAAREARGEFLALLNNDLEVKDAGWLREMVRLAARREVGAVGAKLLYGDGRVQHGGVVTGPDGLVGHVLRFWASDDPGYAGQLALTRALSAVTAACLVMRREVFEEVGGLDEALAVAFNDVDLCLRVGDYGYRIVWTPDAVLTHHESASRGSDEAGPARARAEAEWRFLRDRWGRVLDADPYHNPNVLLHEGGGPLIPAPPRRVRPWRRPALAGVGAIHENREHVF